MRVVVIISSIVMAALVSFCIVLLVRDHASRQRLDRLDHVCEHVREVLCLRIDELNHRPGAGHVELPSNVEIEACAPEIWSDRKLGDAVKSGGEDGYDRELLSQIKQVLRAIPPLHQNAEECSERLSHPQ